MSSRLVTILMKLPHKFNPQKHGESLSVVMGEGLFSLRVGGAMRMHEPLLNPPPLYKHGGVTIGILETT